MLLEESLLAVEQLIEKVSAALLAADPLAVEKNSTELRDAAAQFSRVLEQGTARGIPLPDSFQKRLGAIEATLVMHREGLARLSVTTDRQVAGLLPPTAATQTYGNGLGARAAKPSVARIYRSAS